METSVLPTMARACIFETMMAKKRQSRATNSDGDLYVTGQDLQPVPLTILNLGNWRFGFDSGIYRFGVLNSWVFRSP